MTGSDITELFSNTLQTGSGYLMNAKSGVRSECSETTEKTSVKLCKIDRTDEKDRKSSKNLRIDKKWEFH